MAILPDEQRSARRLSGKQRAFVEAYLGPAEWNATEAASIAGYKGDRQGLSVVGSGLLSNVRVAQAIAQRLAESGASTAELVHRWLMVTRGDISDCINSAGEVNIRKLRDLGLGFLVKGARPSKEGAVILLRDPENAERMLAQHLGTFAAKELKVTHEFATLSDGDLQKEIAASMSATKASGDQEETG